MLAYSTDKSNKNTASRKYVLMTLKVKKLMTRGYELKKAIIHTSTAFSVDEEAVMKAVKLNIRLL